VAAVEGGARSDQRDAARALTRFGRLIHRVALGDDCDVYYIDNTLCQEDARMLRKIMFAVALATSISATTPVLAKGCIRGAIVGGVAGHYVGRGHALAGAAAGCFIAHHHYAQQARAQKAAAHR